MTISHIMKLLPVTVFLLAALTIAAKVSSKWGRAGGALRAVLAVLYALLAIAGVGGLALSVWMVVEGGSKAMLLIVILAPLSLFLITTGIRLFRFVLSPPPETRKPLASSSGWEALADAAERARNAGVTPHLQPEALRKTTPENERRAGTAG
jgi:nitrate reductase NapE component